MKKLFSLVLALCLSFSLACPAFAEEEGVPSEPPVQSGVSEDDTPQDDAPQDAASGRLAAVESNGGRLVFRLMEDEAEGKSAWLLDASGLVGDLVLPEQVEGFPVTRLYVDSLDFFTVTEDGTLSQDPQATGAVCRTDGFTGCGDLTSVSFPGTIRSFEGLRDGDLYAFDGCSKLRKLVFGEGTETLNEGFSGLRLDQVSLPASIKDLSQNEFSGALPILAISAPEGSYGADYAELCTKEFASPFVDMQSNKYRREVNWAYEAGLIYGTTPYEFSPSTLSTKAMCVTVLHRWAKPETDPAAASGFTDVPQTSYYAVPAAWAAENGIIEGAGDGKFLPKRAVTREQFASMIYRTVLWSRDRDETSLPAPSLESFPDHEQVSPYAADGLAWLVSQGALSPRADGRLDPQGAVSRTEMVAILSQLGPLPE